MSIQPSSSGALYVFSTVADAAPVSRSVSIAPTVPPSAQETRAVSRTAGVNVSARMLSASSRSARVCFAVTQARKQIRFCGTAGEETGDNDWRQRARINIWVRIKSQILQGLFRSGDKSAQRTERLGKGAVDERDTVFHSKLFGRASPVFATTKDRVRFVNENACAV